MKRGRWLASVSTISAILAGVSTYISKLNVGDEPKWLVSFALAHKAQVSLALLVLTSFLAIADWFRSYMESRHQEKRVLEKILNDLSKTLFSDGCRNNRLTLFILTVGWRHVLWSLVRLPKFSKPHKWAALRRIHLRSQYLGVYLRPAGSRNRNSCSAFRVSDVSSECEGVVGQIYDQAGQDMIADLKAVDREAVLRLRSSADLKANDIISEYADATNISDYRLLKSCNNFARHFYGMVIRKSDGSGWGVLLLDSLDEECPFIVAGKPEPMFAQRFNDCARLIGKIVS